MTDRELLELAAKAAGIEYEWHPGCGDALRLTAPDAKAIYWNPLTDDGDEARLEAALGLHVIWFSDHVIVEAGERISHCEFFEKYDGDKQAARRRAGVRAAASLASSL